MLKTTTKLLVTSALIAGLTTSLSASENVKWKLATTWGSTLNPFFDAPTNMAKLVEEKFPNTKGKIEINDIGTTIGSHTGPGTVALFFWGKERVD